MSEFDYQILQFTNDFYTNYPNPPYKEILKKSQRAYNCLLFETHCNYFVCVPYRTEIHHKYSYRFKTSKRSRLHKSGLDYTKIVIIQNTNYLSSTNAIIDKDEFTETVNNILAIKNGALKFVEDYVAHIMQVKTLQREEFNRRYKFSPLKYFHNELGISGISEVATTIEPNQGDTP